MAKLTLFFNSKPIEVFQLEQNTSTIGRDPDNTFIIDSLAIAPTHLKVTRVANEYFIESVSEQFPTFINGQLIQKEAIKKGDKINIGKHSLLYSFSTIDDIDTSDTSTAQPSLRPVGKANLQALNGANIGLVSALNKAVNEVNITNTTPAMIAKRADGYYISRLMDDISISIDGNTISSETKLANNNVLNIADNKYLFFTE
jgi:pSer/pThr/pTyr-binding forkhead associated (FHA) protein